MWGLTRAAWSGSIRPPSPGRRQRSPRRPITAMRNVILSVNGLSLNRGLRLLFRDLSFEVAAGELLLLRGANGTGKSSLLRVLAGFLAPASGRVTWSEGTPLPRYLGH